jgi:hypothetical protein
MKKTCKWPEKPGFYGYINYREWFYGPYDTAKGLEDCLLEEQEKDYWFDYDGLTVRYVPKKPADLAEFMKTPNIKYGHRFILVLEEVAYNEATGR